MGFAIVLDHRWAYHNATKEALMNPVTIYRGKRYEARTYKGPSVVIDELGTDNIEAISFSHAHEFIVDMDEALDGTTDELNDQVIDSLCEAEMGRIANMSKHWSVAA